uniref:Uncharacterized protein n=1 Tax=Neogobius melanostomus TaxID=47308 RepID=A0A8C6U5D5_9GOBI
SCFRSFCHYFVNLGDKSKEPKVLRKPRSEDRLLHFSAGLNILHRYEESWYQLHRRTKDSAQAAQVTETLNVWRQIRVYFNVNVKEVLKT